jgi:hypothetical protein
MRPDMGMSDALLILETWRVENPPYEYLPHKNIRVIRSFAPFALSLVRTPEGMSLFLQTLPPLRG